MQLEWLLVGATLVVVGKLLGVRERHGPWLLALIALAAGAAALAATNRRQSPAPTPIAGAGGEEFATSGACRSCHADEYASWHASFHRRMTQLASAQLSASPVLRQGGRLQTEALGRSVELFARRDELWARLPDPGVTSAAPPEAYEASFKAAPIRDVRVELLTGSHHQQAFWVAGARRGELRAVPAVYLIADERLVPRRDAFLNPPNAPEHNVRWNSNCIQCHAVAGEPRHDAKHDSYASAAAELGVACEACHGPAREHVMAMQNPLTRHRTRARSSGNSEPIPSIVNPSRSNVDVGSQICARCHSYFFPKNEADWWQHGFAKSYAPGQDLSQAQLLLTPAVLADHGAVELGASAESLFYQDGTIRVGGREYNSMVLSGCYERGRPPRKLGCLSCHSMHHSDPDDQLREGMRGNAACAECHQEHVSNVSRHTRHGADSTGSLCYNCHMPRTSYALLGAIRSHRIDSPAFDGRTRDRPNACSLCHLERSERWAAEQAARWFGPSTTFELDRPPELASGELPAAAVFALAGDAGVRVVTAAALGRHEGPGLDPALRRQLLDVLEADDYAAVRFVARRSRAMLPSAGGKTLSNEVVEQLRRLRDERPVTIAE